MTCGTRKVKHEGVQVDATLTACKLWISQGRMCWTETYEGVSSSSACDQSRCQFIATD